MKTGSNKVAVVGEICLYGTRDLGSGWLAQLSDGTMLGTGEPVKDRTASEAIWQAVDAMLKAGVGHGSVRIFAPGGDYVSECSINHVPSFGALRWTPAPTITLRIA